MKKTVSLFSVILFAGMLHAQSTCETRVDAHQEATTTQRVAYCLTPQYGGTVDNSNAGLIFSGISTRYVPPAQTSSQKPTARNGYFRPEEVVVARDYVDTMQFPRIAQGRGDELLMDEAKPTLQPVVVTPAQDQPESAPVQQQEAVQAQQTVQETPAGIRARQHKPARRGMQAIAQTQPSEQPVQDASLDGQPVFADSGVNPYAENEKTN